MEKKLEKIHNSKFQKSFAWIFKKKKKAENLISTQNENFSPLTYKTIHNSKFTWKLNKIEISTIFNISENGEICVKYCRYEKYWFMAVWAERFFKKCH